MLNLRCSSLDRIALCPASATPPMVNIEIANDAAAMGTAVHNWLAVSIQMDAEDTIIAPEGVEPDEFEKLCRIAWAAWKRLKPIFADSTGTGPWTEYSFTPIETDGVSLSGTADLVCVPDEQTILGLDWKSGWSDGSHRQQMMGYSWLAINESPLAHRARWHVLNIRYGMVDVFEFSRIELEDWWASLKDAVTKNGDVYRPSPEACGYCKKFAECPARAALIRAAAEQILATDEAIVQEIATQLPASSLARIVERGRLLEKAAKFAVDVVRAVVINAGGEIPIEDGRALRIKTEVQTKIDPRIALPLIQQKIGDRLPEVVTIGKGDLETEIKALAPRGKKGKAVEEFLYELDQAGALSLKPIQKLEIVKPTKEIVGGQ